MSETHRSWLVRTRATVERLRDDLAAADVGEIAHLLRRLHLAIEPAPDRVHRAALSLMLMDICRQTVHLLHDDREKNRCSCHTAAWLSVGALATWDEGDPSAALLDWADGFLAHFVREHPRTGAAEAAALIRSDPAKAWRLPNLAREVGASPLLLRRDFQVRFGVRPSTYVHMVRTGKAVGLLGTPSKVEAIAWEVGYRSKKDLYAALKQWVGATPTQLRAISEEEREWLVRHLRMRSVRGCAGDERSRALGYRRRLWASGLRL